MPRRPEPSDGDGAAGAVRVDRSVGAAAPSPPGPPSRPRRTRNLPGPCNGRRRAAPRNGASRRSSFVRSQWARVGSLLSSSRSNRGVPGRKESGVGRRGFSARDPLARPGGVPRGPSSRAGSPVSRLLWPPLPIGAGLPLSSVLSSTPAIFISSVCGAASEALGGASPSPPGPPYRPRLTRNPPGPCLGASQRVSFAQSPWARDKTAPAPRRGRLRPPFRLRRRPSLLPPARRGRQGP